MRKLRCLSLLCIAVVTIGCEKTNTIVTGTDEQIAERQAKIAELEKNGGALPDEAAATMKRK